MVDVTITIQPRPFQRWFVVSGLELVTYNSLNLASHSKYITSTCVTFYYFTTEIIYLVLVEGRIRQ